MEYLDLGKISFNQINLVIQEECGLAIRHKEYGTSIYIWVDLYFNPNMKRTQNLGLFKYQNKRLDCINKYMVNIMGENFDPEEYLVNHEKFKEFIKKQSNNLPQNGKFGLSGFVGNQNQSSEQTPNPFSLFKTK